MTTTSHSLVAAGNEKTPAGQDGTTPREALAAGTSPLEYMLEVMRDPAADCKRRDDMAKAAAPYAHSRLSTGSDSGNAPVQVSIVRFAE